jgi:hypothetical protein
MTPGFPGAALGTDARGLAAMLNRLNLAKMNCTGTVTLTPNEASTMVPDSRATADSFIGLSPLTANAAAEGADGALFVAAREKGGFTLTHASVTSADRTFVYVIIG